MGQGGKAKSRKNCQFRAVGPDTPAASRRCLIGTRAAGSSGPGAAGTLESHHPAADNPGPPPAHPDRGSVGAAPGKTPLLTLVTQMGSLAGNSWKMWRFPNRPGAAIHTGTWHELERQADHSYQPWGGHLLV